MKPQRHRLLDDDMLAGLGTFDDVARVQAARRQDRDRADVFPRQKLVDVVMRRLAEFRRNRIGACTDGIATSFAPSM
jgi:hypothetical protein